MADEKRDWGTWVRWGFTAVVVPALAFVFGWLNGVSNTANTALDTAEDNATAIESMQEDFKADSERIRTIELTVVRMEGKMDAISVAINETKNLIRSN